MPISVSCPGCEKTLKAKDELAGRRVKCPACGEVVTIPSNSRPGQTQKAKYDSLHERCLHADPAELRAFLYQREFTLIDSHLSPPEQGTAPYMHRVNDFDMVVAFTSNEHAGTFAGAVSDVFGEEGIDGFVVSGEDLIKFLPEGCGVLFNPETDEIAVLEPFRVEQIKSLKSKPVLSAARPTKSGDTGSQAEVVRRRGMQRLQRDGFRPADWLPLPDMNRTVRPPAEITARLMALSAVFAWVSAPESAIDSERLRQHVQENRLRRWLTDEEIEILSMDRGDAHETHVDAIGWKLENMWPLAWVLGFEEEPDCEASQIDDDITQAIVRKYLAELEKNVEEMVRRSKPRSAKEVIVLEDLFYCAHNAVRSAQLGKQTVPDGFDPLSHGGAIHERRHSLTWCLSPGTAWDDTDLST